MASTSYLLATIAAAAAALEKARWPAGTPQGKGGQFAPENGGGGGLLPGEVGKPATWGTAKTTWPHPQSGDGVTTHGTSKPLPKSAVKHPKVDDKGKPVTVLYPSKPSAPESWSDPSAVATAVPGGAGLPKSIGGAPLRSWEPPRDWRTVSGTKEELDAETPLVVGVDAKGHAKRAGAGVVIMEPDGRVWLTKPTNEFGGYENSWPKGGVEPGLSLQQTAIKEAWEETGLKVKITGILGDYEGDTSTARYYIATREGGTPADMGWESQAIRLVPPERLLGLLNRSRDKKIAEAYRSLLHLASLHKAAGAAAKAPQAGAATSGAAWAKQPRWPAGTPLGGQWKAYDGNGFPLPPTLAGGAGSKNPQYQKKADALYALVAGGKVADAAPIVKEIAAKAAADKAAGKTSSHVKWFAQLAQYGEDLVSTPAKATNAAAAADAATGPVDLSKWSKVADKPGGSAPGAIYVDETGAKWLVKGNAAKASTGAALSDARAKNEVLASHLLNAVGAGAPEMKLVDLGGAHGGGLGVASKWEGDLTKFNPANKGQVAEAQKQFAVQAWIGNWDSIGLSNDNTMFDKSGKAKCIDPGGSLLFRAMGEPKAAGAFGDTVTELSTLRDPSKNAAAAKIYEPMTASQMYDSAQMLKQIDDGTITKLVDTYGPGDSAAKAKLAQTLITRRKAVLSWAEKWAPQTAGAGATKIDVPDFATYAEGIAWVKAQTKANGAFTSTGAYKKDVYPKLQALYTAEAKAKAKAEHHAMKPKGPAVSQPGAPANLMGHIAAGTATAAPAARPAPATPPPAAPHPVFTPSTDWTANAAAAAAFGIKTDGAKTIFAIISNSVATGDAKAVKSMVDGVSGMIGEHAAGKKAAVSLDELKILATVAADAMAMQSSMAAKKFPLPPKASTGFKEVDKLYGKAAEYFAHVAASAAAGDAGAMAGLKAMSTKIDLGKLTVIGADGKPGIALVSPGTAAHVAMSKWSASVFNLASTYHAGVADAQKVSAEAEKVEAKVSADATVKAAKVALPDFDGAKLPPSNTNAASHNKKIETIKALAEKGDVAGLEKMTFGTNTYGKKQAKIASDALAALGSSAKLAPSEKPAKATVSVASQQASAAEPKKRTMADLTADKLPNPPDLNNYGAPGHKYSSKPWKIEANTAAMQAMKAAALTGGMEAVDALTFPALDANTGEKTGGSWTVKTHPSAKLILAYRDELESTIKDFLNPPKKLASFNTMTVASAKEAAQSFLSAPLFTKVENQAKDHQFGFWLALGIASNHKEIAPKATFDISSSVKAEKAKDYSKSSALTKQWVKYVQGNGDINRAYDRGEKKYGGLDLEAVAKDLYKDASTFKEGTTTYRHHHMPSGMSKQLETAPIGMVFQSGGGMCTSIDPTATQGFGPHTMVLRYAEGAKAVASYATGNFQGEQEVTTLPGQKFVLLSKEKKPNGAWKYEVLVLPPQDDWP